MSRTTPSHEPNPAAPDHADAAAGNGDHGHAEEPLGPIDVQAWGALLLGVGAGLLVVLCLVITTRLLASPSL